jgi:nitrous oxidase accessory protein NosD
LPNIIISTNSQFIVQGQSIHSHGVVKDSVEVHLQACSQGNEISLNQFPIDIADYEYVVHDNLKWHTLL